MNDWMVRFQESWITLLGTGAGLTVLSLLIRMWFKERTEERRYRRSTAERARDQRQESDRSTYDQRLTRFVRMNLATYIRCGRWYGEEGDDLRSLVNDLNIGGHAGFLDVEVDGPWQALVRKTVALAQKRMNGDVSDEDIRAYNEIRKAWEDAAKRSFGPLPESSDLPIPRRSTQGNAPAA